MYKFRENKNIYLLTILFMLQAWVGLLLDGLNQQHYWNDSEGQYEHVQNHFEQNKFNHENNAEIASTNEDVLEDTCFFIIVTHNSATKDIVNVHLKSFNVSDTLLLRIFSSLSFFSVITLAPKQSPPKSLTERSFV